MIQIRRASVVMLGVGLVLGAILGVGLVATSHLASWTSGSETALQATATDSKDKLIVATGPITNGVEGFFALDCLTGDLQCFVMYNKGPAIKSFGAHFHTNVVKDLGLNKAKRPNYLMVTGEMQFVGRTVGIRPGQCLVYVVDVNTGAFAAYGIPWAVNGPSSGTPQGGKNTMVLLSKGNIRTTALRQPASPRGR